jgi:hypothetical protein
MRQVVIRWLDARSEDGWTTEEDLDVRPATITTLGHLVQETDEVLCVAGSKDEITGQLSGIMFIPRVSVLTRRDIEKSEVSDGTASD